MKKLTNFFKRTAKNEKGQGATEYILLLVVIVGLVLMFGPQIQRIVRGKIESLSNDIGKVTSGN